MLCMRLLWVSLLLAGCLKEKVPFCDNGAFCPEPLVCTERAEAPFCGRVGEVEPCIGQPEEAACTLAGEARGYCEAGICRACDENNAACAYDAWVAMQTPVSVDLYAVYAAGPRDVYAVGRAGTVIHWDGRAWAVLPAPAGSGDLKSLAGAGDELVAGATSSVYHWDGAAWSAPTSTPQFVLGLWAAAATDVFLAGVNGMTGRYTGAWAFAMPTANNLNAVAGTSASDAYAVGASGTVLHWTTAWAPETTGTTHNLLAVSASGARGFAVGRTSGNTPALVQRDGSWSDATALLPADVRTATASLRGVWTNGTHAFAVGDNGIIVHGEGTTWTPMPSNTTVQFYAVAGSGNDVFAVGVGGKVVRYRIP